MLLLFACGTAPRSAPPPYAISARMDEPRLFAAASSPDPEFAFTFDAATGTAYFDRMTADRSALAIQQLRWDGAAWSPAEIAPWSGTYRDIDPFVTPDGRRLYFSSNRPLEGTEPRGDFDLWYLERTATGWAAPRHVDAPLNDERSIGFVSAARDGTIYFDAHRDGVRELYQARAVGDGFAAPTVLVLPPAPGLERSNPLIAPDASFLIFVEDTLDHRGGADLWVTRRQADGSWGPSAPLVGGVNSPQSEFAPGLSPDGRYLFFTSERPGVVAAPASGRPPSDLYQIDLRAALP